MVIVVAISTILFLTAITEMKTMYANHTKYHLNNSFTDVTISSDFDVPC